MSEAETPSSSPADVSRETNEADEPKSFQRLQGERPADMFAFARTAQIEPGGMGSMKLTAPAKVNLCLAVGARRDDGYHGVTSVIHALALHDVLHVSRRPDVRAAKVEAESGAARTAAAGEDGNVFVTVECEARGGTAPLNIPASDNIVFRAIDLLAREAHIAGPEAISVHIEKNIPHEGGLGGGSSDAAAALLGAAKLWGIAADDPLIESIARRLGSDVAFFLHGGCACVDGAGERFAHTLEPMKKPLVLVKPDAGVSTARAYSAFDDNPAFAPEGLIRAATEAESAADVQLFNNLAASAESLVPELARVSEWLGAQAGVCDVLLCGSGSTTFAVTESFSDACRIASAAQARGWWSRTTLFSSLAAAVVPNKA